jgi:hypothetical protein
MTAARRAAAGTVAAVRVAPVPGRPAATTAATGDRNGGLSSTFEPVSATADQVTGPLPNADWVELAAPGRPVVGETPMAMRRIVVPIAVAAVVIAVIVGLVGSLVSRRIAEQQGVHDVAQLTDVLAEAVVQPALTDRMPTDAVVTARVLAPLVRTQLLTGGATRVKLWTPGGTILYSDEPRLIGRTVALEPEARAALLEPRTEAGISDLRRPENQFERGQGRMLEVYRPVWIPSGEPLLFEAYFRYDTVSDHSRELWRGFAGIMLSSLLALLCCCRRSSGPCWAGLGGPGSRASS